MPPSATSPAAHSFLKSLPPLTCPAAAHLSLSSCSYLPGLPERPTAAGLNRLRTARVLEEGMVITVEPGGCGSMGALSVLVPA